MSDAENLVTQLRQLATNLEKTANLAKFSEIWGYPYPPLNKDDLAAISNSLAEKLSSISWEPSVPERLAFFNDLANKVSWAAGNVGSNLLGNPTTHVGVVELLYAVEMRVGTWLRDPQIRSTLALPLNLVNQVSAAKRRLNEATAGIDQLDSKVASIENAFEVSQSLGTTKEELEKLLADANNARKAAELAEFEAKQSSDAVVKHKGRLEQISSEADATLNKLNEAYRAATSQGLAQAFEKKSQALNKSITAWTLWLLASLCVAIVVGSTRFPEILKAVANKPDWGAVLVEIALGALSLGAPLWFAWVSTKQIGHRFRLAEDYAYKAALATAYEGYRNEAARLDKNLESELFAIALGRLNEIPLRLVDEEIPGSPVHELLKPAQSKESVRASDSQVSKSKSEAVETEMPNN